MDARVRSWNELHEQLYAGSWQAPLGRFRSSFAFRGMSSAADDLSTTLFRLGPSSRRSETHVIRNFRKYAQRNAVFLPMVYRADVSISQDVGTSVAGRPNRVQIRLDILNLTNLLHHDWGVAQGFVTTQPLISAGVDATGAPLYRLATSGGQLVSKSFQKVVTTADVWRMQLGVRYLLNW